MTLPGVSSARAPLEGALEELLGALVEDPSALTLRAENGPRGTIFVATVPDAQVGRLVGRRGRTAEAVRTLLALRGRQEGRRYGFEVRSA